MNWHEHMKINVVNNENGSGYERYTNNSGIHIQVFEMLFSIKKILIAVSAYFNCKHTESQIGKDLHSKFESICSDKEQMRKK